MRNGKVIPNSALDIPEGRRWCLSLIVTQATVGSIPTSGALIWGSTGAGGLPLKQALTVRFRLPELRE